MGELILHAVGIQSYRQVDGCSVRTWKPSPLVRRLICDHHCDGQWRVRVSNAQIRMSNVEARRCWNHSMHCSPRDEGKSKVRGSATLSVLCAVCAFE